MTSVERAIFSSSSSIADYGSPSRRKDGNRQPRSKLVQREPTLDKVLLTELTRTSTFLKTVDEDVLGLESDPDTDLEDVEANLTERSREPCTLINREPAAEHAELLYRTKCRELGVVPISYFLRHLTEEEMCLRCQHFGPQGAQALAVPLMVNTNIKKLDLSSNHLGDEGMEAMVAMLIENLYITELNLSFNNITSAGVKHLCRLLMADPQISRLDLSGNPLGDKAAKYFAAVLQHNHLLHDLRMSACGFGQEFGEMIGPELGTNETLSSLDLSWNQIRLKGAAAIANGLKENVRLHSLKLGWNGLGMEGAKVLQQALADNQTLEELDLQSNRLTNEGVHMIAKGLSKNDSLKVLRIGQNPFTNIGAFSLVKAVQVNENSSLEYINLRGILVKEDFFEVLKELQASRKIEAKYEEFNPSIKHREKSSTDPPGKVAMDHLLNHLRDTGTNATDAFRGPIHQAGDMVVPQDLFINTVKGLDVKFSKRQMEQLCEFLATPDEYKAVDITLLIQHEQQRQACET